MVGKLIFFQLHQPQLVKKELYRGPVTVTIDKQNFGTGLERQVLQVQGLVYWSTGCNLRNFPSPVYILCVSTTYVFDVWDCSVQKIIGRTTWMMNNLAKTHKPHGPKNQQWQHSEW